MYKLVLSNRFKRSFKKLDKQVAGVIAKWIDQHLYKCKNPRAYGHSLKGKYEGCWRYRIGNYRIIARIEDNQLKLIALDIGHRRDIYK